VPWNAFVASQPYFEDRLELSGSEFISSDYEAVFALLFNLANVLSLCVLLYHQTSHSSSEHLDSSNSNSDCDDDSTISTLHEWSYCLRRVYYFFERKFKFRSRETEEMLAAVDAQEELSEDNNDPRQEQQRLHRVNQPYLSTILEGANEDASTVQTQSNQNHDINRSRSRYESLHDVNSHASSTHLSTKSQSNKYLGGEENANVSTVQSLIQPYLIAYGASLLLCTLLVFNTELSSDNFFIIMVVIVSATGISCSVASAGLFHFAERFGNFNDGGSGNNGHKTYFLAGQTVAGVIIAVVNVCATAVQEFDYEEECSGDAPPDATADADPMVVMLIENSNGSGSSSGGGGYKSVDWTAGSTFGITTLILASCVYAFYVLERLPVASAGSTLREDLCEQEVDQEHFKREHEDSATLGEFSCSSLTTATSSTTASSSSLYPACTNSDTNFDIHNAPNDTQLLDQLEHDVIHWQDAAAVNHDNSNTDAHNFRILLKTIWCPAMTVLCNYIVTLMIFPVWTSKLQSVQYCSSSANRLVNDLFQPLLLLLFNCSDLVGKFTGGYCMRFMSSPADAAAEQQGEEDSSLTAAPPSNSSSKKLMYASLSRFLLIPLFLICHVESDDKDSSSNDTLFTSTHALTSIAKSSDAWAVALIILLGFSNGSVSSMGMMHAPDLLKSSKEKEECSTVMTLVLSTGLLIGSAGSFLMLKMGTGEW